MDSKDHSFSSIFSKTLLQLLLVIGLLMVLILTTLVPCFLEKINYQLVSPRAILPNKVLMSASKDDFWKAPDLSTLENQANKNQILYGKELIANTSFYLGKKGTVAQISNGMNCQNCHLEAGTKVFGNNYGSVFATYPKFRARSGTVENIYKRVNDCIERSLNGQALDSLSKEMQAIKAYIEWLGKDVPKGQKAKGAGLKELAFLDRAADTLKGKIAYQMHCQRCHQADGQGQADAQANTYIYPPLWGENSYNIGAGLYRISNFAKYVKYNMPQGVSHENPILTDEEAWDIAAYINAQSRPRKDFTKDWYKIEAKPFDHPFAPFADNFGEAQHKFGPFKPILEQAKKAN